MFCQDLDIVTNVSNVMKTWPGRSVDILSKNAICRLAFPVLCYHKIAEQVNSKLRNLRTDLKMESEWLVHGKERNPSGFDVLLVGWQN